MTCTGQTDGKEEKKGKTAGQGGSFREKENRRDAQLKVLNTINFAKSMHYNPFHYIRTEKDIMKLVNTIIANTKGDGEKSSEDFWVKAERLLYCVP